MKKDTKKNYFQALLMIVLICVTNLQSSQLHFVPYQLEFSDMIVEKLLIVSLKLLLKQ